MSDWDERIMAALIVGKRHRAFVRTNYETVLNVPKAQSKSVMEINNGERVKQELKKKRDTHQRLPCSFDSPTEVLLSHETSAVTLKDGGLVKKCLRM